MQPNCPYQLIEQLGSTEVGTVWSAVDEQGAPLTVAVLDANAAADRRWRDPFVAAVTALAQSRETGRRVVNTGLTGPSPWIAYTASDGQGAELVFQSLGLQYVPAKRDGNPWGSGPGQASQSAQPTQPAQPTQSAQPQPSLPAMPGSPWAPRPAEAIQPVQPVPQQPAPQQHTEPPAPQPPTPEYGTSGWLAEAAASIQWPLAPVSNPPELKSPPPDEPESETPVPVMPAPVSPGPVSVPPVSVPPVSVSPGPVSVPPVSVPPVPSIETAPLPWVWNNQDPLSTQVQSPYAPPSYPPLFDEGPARPRGRTRLWVVLGVVVVVLVAAGSVLGWQLTSGTGQPQAGPSPSASTLAVPTPTPLRPGLEPPLPGDWPKQWPKFGPTDKVASQALDGVGFAVTVPTSWKCARAGSAAGFVKYSCGTTVAGDQLGGELIVRDCAAPCDPQQQAAMRGTEEAWGLQWREAGENVSLAETTKLNGAARYGMVIVAYRHSTTGGALDKQVVLRLTSPVSWLDTLRKIANAVRDSAVF